MPKMPQWVSITNDHTLSSRVRGNSQARFRISGRRSDPLTDCTYSSKDQPFTERLYADLQHTGVRCWFAPEDLKTGDKIRHRIDESIRLYDKLLIVLSKHSIGSHWVEHEVEMALAKEQKVQRTVLFPLRLDTAIMDMEQDGWPAEVRHTRHITDFSHWKQHDAYQKALHRLLRDLQPAILPQKGP